MASVKNYTDAGGAKTHIAGELQIESGGSVDVESGATFKVGGTELSSTELMYLDTVTAGTVTASKAVVAGTTKNIDTLLFTPATLAAAGANQGNAAQIVSDVTYVTGANGTTCVKLPVAVAGRQCIVINTVQAQILPVYPNTDAAINWGAANAVYNLPAGTMARFYATSATQWYTTVIPEGVTATATELNYCDVTTAGTAQASKAAILGTNKNLDTLVIADGGLCLGAGAGTAVSATAAELNILDNATVTYQELNTLDGEPAAATFVVGAEGGNVINVAIQLKDANNADLAVRGAVKAYLSDDANGDSLVTTAPAGGVAIGTDGLLIPDTPALTNALIVDGNLAISGGDATQFKTTQTACYHIAGVSHTKAATDSLTFTAAHVITASKFGCILVQINAAGTISTKVVASPQAYDNAPAALAALPAADAGNVALGYIAIENNAGDWTANTDDMTNASDVTTAAFNDSTESTVAGAKSFTLVSESDGDIDINITTSAVVTMYLILVLPNGKLTASGAIAFT